MRAALLMVLIAGAQLSAQGWPPASRPTTEPRRPSPVNPGGQPGRPFEVGPGGWPIVPAETNPPSGRNSPRSDFQADRASRRPAWDSGGSGAGPGVRTAGSEAGDWSLRPARSTVGRSDPLRLDSPLRDVFKVVRQPADLAALGGVTVWLRLTLYDDRGRELGEREITHQADLEYPDRDRLMFTDGRVYGRLGGAVYVERLHRPWPTLDDEARGELELMGMLLRSPWIFAEGRRYVVFPVEYDAWQGANVVRVRIERRPARDRVVGPQRVTTPVDRFELICDPDTFVPRQLLYYLAETGVSRRVLLDDYREVGGVRMPWRRTFLLGDDRVAMVMRVMRIETGQRFAEHHFRPNLR